MFGICYCISQEFLVQSPDILTRAWHSEAAIVFNVSILMLNLCSLCLADDFTVDSICGMDNSGL